MDTYASEGLSKMFLPILLLYCSHFCHDNLWKQEVLFPDFIILFLKFIIKSLIHCKLVNFFLAVDCLSLANFKNINFVGREYSDIEGDGWKYRGLAGKLSFFFVNPVLPQRKMLITLEPVQISNMIFAKVNRVSGDINF